MNDETTYGGFFKSNIRKWIIKECLESGNPEEFFAAIIEAVDDISDIKTDYPDYWDEAYGE